MVRALPPSLAPDLKRVARLCQSSGCERDSTRAPTANGEWSTTPTLRTRKEVEMFAPWKAAPRAMASSPFRWTLSSRGSFLVRCELRYSLTTAWTLGTRTPPPMISTASMSSAVMFAARRAISMGAGSASKASTAAASSCERVTVVWKSTSWCSDGIVTKCSVFAERTSLVFFAVARIFAMGRARALMLSPGFAFSKASASSSLSARSTANEPASSDQPLPRTSSWPTVLFLNPSFSTKLEYSTTLAWASSEPTL
mmetsp:Transcript_22714/g.71111  ORF Transcript_22714/g.71111 Transcript_22714/m.71111 type:complete len:255 (-) Transcript_22714:752-1516(-)